MRVKILIRRILHEAKIPSLLRAIRRSLARPMLAFDIPMDGEWPYLRPIVLALSCFKDLDVILVKGENCRLAHPDVLRDIECLYERVKIVDFTEARNLLPSAPKSLYVTSEQFCRPLSRPSVCIFHGQPSKGLTFTREVLSDFDHFFLLGPLQERCLAEFLERQSETTAHPALHAIGYPKSDDLISGKIESNALRSQYNVPDNAKLVLYAPAFNELCTLRTIGAELIQAMAQIEDVFVLVKLAPDMMSDLDEEYFTGGVNWRQRIEDLGLRNVAVAAPLDVSGCLAASDIMVTDVSGVAYEMLAVGKQVIFFDCPDFYSEYVMKRTSGLSLSELISNDTMNGGRHYGVVVDSISDVCSAITGPPMHVDQLAMQKMLLFNPGRSTDVAVGKLRQILGLRA